MVRQVCRCLHHAPCVARGADATALTGEGYEVGVPAITTAGAGKTVGKDAAFEVFTKGLAHKGLWRVVVALAVELTRTGHRVPGLEVFGNGLVKQRALRMARVVEFEFASRWPTRVRMQMRLRWTVDGGHGAVPAGAGCLMILGLYPALCILCCQRVAQSLLN